MVLLAGVIIEFFSTNGVKCPHFKMRIDCEKTSPSVFLWEGELVQTSPQLKACLSCYKTSDLHP